MFEIDNMYFVLFDFYKLKTILRKNIPTLFILDVFCISYFISIAILKKTTI